MRRADGPLRQRFEGLEFRDNSALAAMAVKNRAPLPYRGEFDAQRSTVFTTNARLDGMQSLLILPLVSSDQALGSLTIAADYTSGLDFVRLFDLGGGMPTRVTVPEARLDGVMTKLAGAVHLRGQP